MTRYVKQQDTYNCGPILVANVIKWAGNSFSWQDEKEGLIRKCGTHPPEPASGCDPGRLQRIMEWEGKRREHTFGIFHQGPAPTLKALDYGLAHGAVALSIYYYSYPGSFLCGHYFLCTGRTEKRYETVNLYGYRSSVVRIISREKMSKLLRPCRKDNYFWSITTPSA